MSRINYQSTIVLADAPAETVIPSAALNQTAFVNVPAAAGRQTLLLTNQGWQNGARLKLVFSLPEIEGIEIDIRTPDADGTQLLPTERFPDGLYTTDGYTTTLTIDLVKKGNTTWRYVEASAPA